MAEISEKLTLVDRFSNVFSKFIALAKTASGETQNIKQETSSMESVQISANQSLEKSISNFGDYQNAAKRLEKQIASMNLQFEVLSQQQESLVAAGKTETKEFERLENTLNRLGEKIRLAENQSGILTSKMSQLKGQTWNTAQKQNDMAKSSESLSDKIKKLTDNLTKAGKTKVHFDGLARQIQRVAITLFSVEKIINAVRNSMERAPDSIAQSFEKAGQNIQNVFAGAIVSAMGAMQPAIDRFNAFLSTEKGSQLIGSLSKAFELLGNVAAFAIDLLVTGAEWVADNWSAIFPVLVAIGAYMAASAAIALVSWIAAAWPFMLIIAAISLVIVWLQKLGVSFEEMAAYIGGVIGVLVAGIVNTVVGLINGIIQHLWSYFVEPFIGIIEWVLNVANGGFDSFGDAVANLIGNIISWFLSLGKIVTKIIDAIFGTNWTAGLNSLQDQVLSWGKNENAITLDRNAPTIDYRMDYTSAWDKGFEIGGNVGSKLDDLQSGVSGMFNSLTSLDSGLKSVSDDTSAIKKSVAMSEEDIKSLVDMAERQYINNINLTAQTPVITINGANTGNTAEDRQNLANTIRDILIEETAAGSVRSTARAW